MAVEDVWVAVLDLLKTKVSSEAFDAWLKPTKLVEFTDGIVKVGVPNNFFTDWLQHHYLKEILLALKEITGRNLGVEFVVSSGLTVNSLEKTPEPRLQSLQASPYRLRSRYTFDTFIVGEGNRLACAAAKSVANNLGRAYNPLFIYGGVGLGKTHLLQAIGNAAVEIYPGLKFCYTPAEALFLELIQAIGKDTRVEFKNKYRGLDLLLLDDVHYLVGKESLQDEIFYTFNALHDAGSQVVFTSDRPPKDIPTLQERLISRLGSGLVVDIQHPDLETRVAILLQKAKQEEFNLPEELAIYIATRIRSNIRTLEAALIRLIALYSLTGRELNTELADEALKGLVSPEQPLDANRILSAVADHFQVSVTDLKGQIRTKRVALARQTTMFLLRNLLNLSLKDIGYFMGGKDHSTVIHALDKISDLRVKDPAFASALDKLSRTLKP